MSDDEHKSKRRTKLNKQRNFVQKHSLNMNKGGFHGKTRKQERKHKKQQLKRDYDL